MNKIYIIISVSDYKDATAATRTVHCGEVTTATVGSVPVSPMIAYTFAIPNPTADDNTNYDVGKYVSLTIAPAAKPAS